MNKIKVAVVGTGNICRGAHMPVYMKRDDVEVILARTLTSPRHRSLQRISVFLRRMLLLRSFLLTASPITLTCAHGPLLMHPSLSLLQTQAAT